MRRSRLFLIVGLIAARLKERHRRPAFAIAFDQSGKGSGSGRSGRRGTADCCGAIGGVSPGRTAEMPIGGVCGSGGLSCPACPPSG